MTPAQGHTSYFIGWDVGGWHCDRNKNSRDAIVILDATLSVIGTPWRGNLRETINNANNALDFTRGLFAVCETDYPDTSSWCTLAIDTPLGFSEAFQDLIAHRKHVEQIDSNKTNPYLFRRTERILSEHDIQPLSPVTHMIGSQATKGMHVLAKFAPHVQECGVWNDGTHLTVIEAYPSACKESRAIHEYRNNDKYSSIGNADKKDAYTCALIAYLYAKHKDKLFAPGPSIPKSEGWIWVPADVTEERDEGIT